MYVINIDKGKEFSMAIMTWRNGSWGCTGNVVNGYMTNGTIDYQGFTRTYNWSGTESDFLQYCNSH